MSEETQIKVRMPISGWLAIAGTLAAAVGSWSIAQAQLRDHERQLQALENKASAAAIDAMQFRVLLERIDERTAEMKRQMERAHP